MQEEEPLLFLLFLCVLRLGAATDGGEGTQDLRGKLRSAFLKDHASQEELVRRECGKTPREMTEEDWIEFRLTEKLHRALMCHPDQEKFVRQDYGKNPGEMTIEDWLDFYPKQLGKGKDQREAGADAQ